MVKGSWLPSAPTQAISSQCSCSWAAVLGAPCLYPDSPEPPGNSHLGHVSSYAQIPSKEHCRPRDHTHTQVGTNLGKHSCVHLHGHMLVGDWEPSHWAPGSPSPDPPPHIGSTYRRVSLSSGCVAKERHRDGYPLPRPKVTLAGPSPSFPFSMPTCKDPCVVLWASLSSSIHLPSQSPSWAKNKNCEFLDTVYFIS